MKWFFYVIVFVYMFYRAVYGAKPEVNSVTVDYDNSKFLKAGSHQSINCKASNKNQKVEWRDPSGDVVKRIPTNRVFAQEHFVQSMKGGRTPALVLNFKELLVSDSGTYECHSGDLKDYANICVIDPLEFVEEGTEVTAGLGRSITLSCQAKGDPEPRIIWRRNEENIDEETDNSKYKVMTKYNSQGFEGLLTITSLEPEDSGVYSCIAFQENQHIDNCHHFAFNNITLLVKHAPIFADGNDTKLIYGKNNESVDLVCSAKGFPAPTYRWFKDIGDETLIEYDKKQINLKEDSNEAVLTLVASSSTFGQRFKCQANNDHGESVKYFSLLKMEKPQRPNEVNVYNVSESQIQFNVSWYDEVLFPIKGFDIQYLKTSELRRSIYPPREVEWRKGTLFQTELDDNGDADPDFGGILATLSNLESDTEYWVRLRATNTAGLSSWSEPVVAATKEAEEEVTEEPTSEAKIANTGFNSDATFYGIFFAGGILVVAAACMFAMRMV